MGRGKGFGKTVQLGGGGSMAPFSRSRGGIDDDNDDDDVRARLHKSFHPRTTFILG